MKRRACLSLTDSPADARAVAGAAEAVGLRYHDCASESAAVAALARESNAIIVAVGHHAATILAQRSTTPVVIIGQTASVDEAVEAMQSGAADFIAAPLRSEALQRRLRKLLERTAPVTGATPEYLGLVGSSKSMLTVYETIAKVSRFKTSVLLLGESGTGKELIARALHARGPRSARLFVPINCATLGRDLLENELFGHERGAFTGANERKKGLFELADGGTLFLDEIAEMDLSTQAKLLRVLERSAFRRVGGSDKVKVDLSVIAATNKNLPAQITAGRFREDLYYRLKVVTLVVPPLRDRRDDIPALVDHFVADFNRRNDQKIKGIAPAALDQFLRHDWPGNVRELKNAIESAAVLSTGEILEAIDVMGDEAGFGRSMSSASAGSDMHFALGMPLAHIEQRVITRYIEHYPTREEAARALGLGLRTLYSKLRQYAISDTRPRLPKRHARR